MKKKVAIVCAFGFFAGIAGTASADVMTSWMGTNYAVITEWNGTWDQARETVSSSLGNGWDLAAVTSLEEQNFLASVLADNNARGEFWLGGWQTADDGLAADAGWQWVTGEAWDFSAWAKEEPNDWRGINEGHLGIWSSTDWKWNDEHGNANITGFVAEKIAAASPSPVPEPASMLLVGTGLLGLAGFRRRTGK